MTRAGASAFAPGRVNLIGEHTDYNEGLCLPFSLARGVTVQATPSDGPDTTVHTRTFDERDHFDAEHPEWADGWRAFARGVAAELRDAGHAIAPAQLEVSSDLPTGAGMASSAAYEVALALALLALSGEQDLDRGALARLCSRVENEWVGARTGLVDQFSSLFGRSDSALLLDFQAMTVDPVPLRLAGWSLATVQSGADRNLAGSGYNDRADECRRAAAMLGLKSLREATPDAVATLPEPYRRRARHVVSENGRVRAAAEALADDDLERLAGLLDAGHASLRDDLAVSVPRVEATVERAKAAGARGAKLMGGGFGGSVLALFPPGVELPAEATVAIPGPAAHVLGRVPGA